MATVLFDGVSKVFNEGTKDEVRAVDNLTLRIEDGEFVVLVGPSGCGKSTSLRMIAGLERPTSGRILIGDEDVTYLHPRARNIAMVFQDYALYPHMTARENLSFGLRNLKYPKDEIERRVNEAARLLGITNLLDRRPRQLSGGQRQRVALGRAIVRNPSVFLLDEPLSNLDAKLRVQMRVELAQLQRRIGTTTVYVTHDQEEAMTLGHRIVVMKEGVVQQVADPETLYRVPANLFVAGFIGSPPMNLIPGELVRGGESFFLLVDGGPRLEFPAAVAAGLAPHAGRRVVLGIRPESMRIAAGEPETGADLRLRAEVNAVEMLGAHKLVYFHVGGLLAAAAVDADLRIQPPEVVPLAVGAEKLHFFDAESEARIEMAEGESAWKRA